MKQFAYALGLLLILTAFSNDGLLKYYHLKRFEQNIVSKNNQIEEENKALRQEIRELQNPKTIERHIRNTLGYVTDNELVFELSDRTPETPVKFLGL